MITAVIRTDEHVSDKPPESRTDDYLETCLDKLTQIGDIARDVDADLVIDNGDTFHNKSARENSHLMVSKVIDVHRDYPCPVYQNPGNHDFPYSNVDFVRRQPLQVLFSSGVFNRLDDVTLTDGQECSVRFVGFPYQNDYAESDIDPDRGDEDHLVACAHCYASKTGGDMFGNEPILSYEELKHNSPDGFVFGHWHIDQGIEKWDDAWFMNLGSMTRGSLTEDNLERIPRIGILRVWKEDGVVHHSLDTHQLEVKPPDDIFDLERREELQREQEEMEDFLDTLAEQAETEGTDDLERYISDIEEFDDEVKTRSMEYLRQVREGS